MVARSSSTVSLYPTSLVISKSPEGGVQSKGDYAELTGNGNDTVTRTETKKPSCTRERMLRQKPGFHRQPGLQHCQRGGTERFQFIMRQGIMRQGMAK